MKAIKSSKSEILLSKIWDNRFHLLCEQNSSISIHHKLPFLFSITSFMMSEAVVESELGYRSINACLKEK